MTLDDATIDAIRAVAAAAKPARKELQRLAKLCGIKANQKSTVILEELEKLVAAAPPPPAPALPRRSIAAPPVASLPPLPPPVASAAVAPPPRQPSLPAAAVAATLGKIDAAVQEVNRAQQIKADRGAKSAKKAEDHNRARTVGAMRDMRPPVPQAHRVGAQNVPRPTKQLRPHGEKKAHVLSPPPRAFLSTASPVRSPPPPLSPANAEPWRLPPKSAAKRPEAAREFRRDLAVAASKASRGAAADARRGL
ncbi:unnamed protein product [Pelagomonas calceolata]|uniref:Uncharacterized protein n=2 Tax=Pelagomonas calceolata TaxID=35677 RepID=A0A8J2SJH0_9STRA|nr:unnamed protein product [Pelagomonas calceolata]